jgi:hypothetical protein
MDGLEILGKLKRLWLRQDVMDFIAKPKMEIRYRLEVNPTRSRAKSRSSAQPE